MVLYSVLTSLENFLQSTNVIDIRVKPEYDNKHVGVEPEYDNKHVGVKPEYDNKHVGVEPEYNNTHVIARLDLAIKI